MRDVAEIVGVSTTTVSRALASPGKVSPSTLHKIEEAVHAVGYTPRSIYRKKEKKGPRTILVFADDISCPFFAETIKGVEKVAIKNRCSLLISYCSSGNTDVCPITEFVTTQSVDGILLLSPLDINKDMLATLPPIVMANMPSPHPAVPSVHIDNLSAAFEIGQFLHQLGHYRIACIAGPENKTLTHHRVHGYVQALQRCGIEIDKSLIKYTDLSHEAGAGALVSLMSLPEPPTAIFCHSDMAANGVLSQAQKMGVSVPETLSVVGFGNSLAQYSLPGLTTVGQPSGMIGQRSMLLLLNLINGDTESAGSEMMDYELIIRESTAYAGVNAIRNSLTQPQQRIGC